MKRALRIITEMINKTKVNIRQSSFHLLFWGWLIFACSLSEYLLWKFTDFAHPYYVWLFVIPGVFVSMIYGFTKGRKAKVHTYADKLYMWTWMGFFFASIVLFIVQVTRHGTLALYSCSCRFPDIYFGVHNQIQTLDYRRNELLDNCTYYYILQDHQLTIGNARRNAYRISYSGLYAEKESENETV